MHLCSVFILYSPPVSFDTPLKDKLPNCFTFWASPAFRRQGLRPPPLHAGAALCVSTYSSYYFLCGSVFAFAQGFCPLRHLLAAIFTLFFDHFKLLLGFPLYFIGVFFCVGLCLFLPVRRLELGASIGPSCLYAAHAGISPGLDVAFMALGFCQCAISSPFVSFALALRFGCLLAALFF